MMSGRSKAGNFELEYISLKNQFRFSAIAFFSKWFSITILQCPRFKNDSSIHAKILIVSYSFAILFINWSRSLFLSELTVRNSGRNSSLLPISILAFRSSIQWEAPSWEKIWTGSSRCDHNSFLMMITVIFSPSICNPICYKSLVWDYIHVGVEPWGLTKY